MEEGSGGRGVRVGSRTLDPLLFVPPLQNGRRISTAVTGGPRAVSITDCEVCVEGTGGPSVYRPPLPDRRGTVGPRGVGVGG